MAEWTIEAVAARLADAANTSHRLPPERVQGYFSVWPAFMRRGWEVLANEDRAYRPLPPSPAAIERMLEAMRWMQWLEAEQRHLVWMRANRYEWQQIGRRFACDRNTAARRWRRLMELVAFRLNHDAG